MTPTLLALIIFLVLRLGIGVRISKRIHTEADSLVGGITVYASAAAAGISSPYLASLGSSLALRGLGCAMDYAAS